MKDLLLIVGIAVIIACVLSLLYAMLNQHGYRHLRDGSAELYARLHRRMVLYYVIGVVLAVIGAACFVIRFKL